MSDQDRRGSRLDDEPPLSLGRRARSQSRGRGPAPVTLIVSLVLLLLVAGGVAFMYRSGVRTSAAPPTLGAPLGDERAPAPAQAPAVDATDGLSISKDDPGAASGANPRLAPAPEAPLPEQAPPTAAIPQIRPPASADPIGGLIQKSEAPAAAPKPKPVQTAQAGQTPQAPRAASAAKPAAPRPLNGPVSVQIGAFSSEDLADQAWDKAAAAAPGAMAGKGKHIAIVARDSGPLYRTSITGFSSRDEAVALCAQIKPAVGGCFVR